MENLAPKLNKMYAGMIAGLIGPWIGATIFYLTTFNHKSVSRFIDIVLSSSSSFASLIAVSLVFNLVFFLITMRYEWYNAARGIITAVFIYAPIVVYFEYFG